MINLKHLCVVKIKLIIEIIGMIKKTLEWLLYNFEIILTEIYFTLQNISHVTDFIDEVKIPALLNKME